MAGNLVVDCVLSGSGRREPGHQVPWRTLPFVLLEWCNAGAWEIERAKAPAVRVPANRVLVIAADQHHAMKAIAPAFTSQWLMLRIEIDGRSVDLGRHVPLLQPSAASARIRALAAMARAAGPDLAGAVTRSLALQDLVRQLLSSASGPVPLPSPPPARLALVLGRMQQEIAQPLRRTDLARWAGLSPTRFHAVFHAAMGVAPMLYLRNLRLLRAREWLTTGDLPIHTIAERCGFPSVHHFSRLFHRTQGCPPSRYRDERRR